MMLFSIVGKRRGGRALAALAICLWCCSSEALSVIVVGGSSGMGKALAKEVVSRGGRVLLASRSATKLEAARCEIGQSALVTTRVLDASVEASVEDFAAEVSEGDYDCLVVSAAGAAPHGSIEALPTAETRGLFDSKFWSAYHCAKHLAPKLSDGRQQYYADIAHKGGAIAFVAGVLNRRPGLNSAPLACVNGALEGLTRSLALQLGPRLRVNCLSPGFCDTERFDKMDPDRRQAMLANTASSLPLRRVGEPRDMGEALYYLLTAKFATGIVLDVDGGHHIRQYADASTDPMRQ